MKMASPPISPDSTLKTDGVSIKRVTLMPGRFPVNAGRKLTILATLGGAWKIRTGDAKTVRIEHGEICVVPRDFRHQSTFYQTCENLMLAFDDAVVKRLAGECGIDEPHELLSFGKVTDWTVRQLVALLAEEMSQPVASRGTVFAQVLAYAILGCLLRNRAELPADVTDPRVRLARSHIARHLNGDLTVRSLARLAAMSESQFARSFKESTGRTPHRFVLERRVAAAEYLVRTTSRPLHEIAAECGFQSQSHFSSTFAQVLGKTPSAVRTCLPLGATPQRNGNEAS